MSDEKSSVSGSFKFAGGEGASEDLFTVMRGLNSLSMSDFTSIITEMMQSYSDRSFSNDLEMIDKCAESLSERSEGRVKLKNMRRICDALLSLIKGAIRFNVSTDNICDDLIHLGLDSERSSVFGQNWAAHYVALAKSASAASVNHNQIIGMQWKFCVTASSDSVRHCGSTFLQIQLRLATPNGEKEVPMEMSIAQFQKFLKEMEKAQKIVTTLDS